MSRYEVEVTFYKTIEADSQREAERVGEDLARSVGGDYHDPFGGWSPFVEAKEEVNDD